MMAAANGAVPGDPEGAGDPAAPGSAPEPGRRKRRARWLYARVMVVQVVTLILLWLLQASYGT